MFKKESLKFTNDQTTSVKKKKPHTHTDTLFSLLFKSNNYTQEGIQENFKEQCSNNKNDFFFLDKKGETKIFPNWRISRNLTVHYNTFLFYTALQFPKHNLKGFPNALQALTVFNSISV